MASASTPASMSGASRPDRMLGICQIVGFVCIFGFVLNMAVLFLPPQLRDATWRLGFLQQFGDRSLVLLIGAALMIAGSIDSRRWLRQLSLISLFLGGIYLITCLLVVKDTLSLRQQALNNISAQETQVQNQIRNAQSNPAALGQNVTAEDLQRASQTLTGQATIAKQTAQTTVLKTGIISIVNLVAIGLGLVGLGRYGLSTRR
ncbi:HpsJ-like protein, cyanoexosortase C-associated [Leptolyngbya ohadii]|uniref:HpsJ-like protein, cyanoexosortase C-associated n=1 Tax=Leptolyngbya ohadii TaxID=1962290 RepID=UPI000B59E731|nr:HpsJ family protein [Leptolyngbya ohadii]